MRVDNAALAAVPMALVAGLAALPNAAAAQVVVADDAFESRPSQPQRVAQLRLPRLRLPSLPSVQRVFAITPERRALLNTIRYAEGTWKDGRDHGYRVLYGGSLFQDLSRHPEKVVVKRYSSAAAGAYQFLPGTWRQVARELKLPSFEPQHQDQAALRLVERRGALEEVDRHGLTPKVMNQLAPEWASFPTLSGRSYYGQPVKAYSRLRSFYDVNLKELRRLRDERRAELARIPELPEVCTGSRIACATHL